MMNWRHAIEDIQIGQNEKGGIVVWKFDEAGNLHTKIIDSFKTKCFDMDCNLIFKLQHQE
jgi:hypothetical protein